MPNHSAAIVQKLWNYCNVLRDDGMSCGDCIGQAAYSPRALTPPALVALGKSQGMR